MIIKFEKYIEPNNWYSEDEPKLYDYVILDINWYSPDINYYLNNNIGQISKIKKYTKDVDHIQYQILYENAPEKFVKNYLQHNRLSYVYKKQIKHHSSNKEKLELILQAKKYNI